jgi:hypothetical protein
MRIETSVISKAMTTRGPSVGDGELKDEANE